MKSMPPRNTDGCGIPNYRNSSYSCWFKKSHTTAGKLVPCLEIGIPIESLNLEKANVDHALFSLAKHKANFWSRQGCLWHCK